MCNQLLAVDLSTVLSFALILIIIFFYFIGNNKNNCYCFFLFIIWGSFGGLINIRWWKPKSFIEVIDESFRFDATNILNVKMISGFPQQKWFRWFSKLRIENKRRPSNQGSVGAEPVVWIHLTAGNESFVKLMTMLLVATTNDQWSLGSMAPFGHQFCQYTVGKSSVLTAWWPSKI